jgi:uncharacterized protein (TIGR02466 family)
MVTTKHEWWSTPVWEIETGLPESFNLKLDAEINSLVVDKDQPFNIWNYKKPCLMELKEIITKHVNEVADGLFNDNFDFKPQLSRGWVNRQRTGEGMLLHDHGNSVMAITYYIKAPAGSGDLLLIDPRASHIWDRQRENNVDGIRHKRITPTPSKLVIFPAYILHMVENNKSPNVRVSLSTNISNGKWYE